MHNGTCHNAPQEKITPTPSQNQSTLHTRKDEIHVRPVNLSTTIHATHSRCLATVSPTDAVTGENPSHFDRKYPWGVVFGRLVGRGGHEAQARCNKTRRIRSTDQKFFPTCSYNTSSNRTRIVKTPGGELRILHIKKRGTAPKCGDCGSKLPGVS